MQLAFPSKRTFGNAPLVTHYTGFVTTQLVVDYVHSEIILDCLVKTYFWLTELLANKSKKRLNMWFWLLTAYVA
jgi:hypothetical protein